MGEMKEKTANQSADVPSPENSVLFREPKSEQELKNLLFISISS